MGSTTKKNRDIEMFRGLGKDFKVLREDHAVSRVISYIVVSMDLVAIGQGCAQKTCMHKKVKDM